MQAKLSISLDVADFRKRPHSSFSLLIDRDALGSSVTNENRTKKKCPLLGFIKAACENERKRKKEFNRDTTYKSTNPTRGKERWKGKNMGITREKEGRNRRNRGKQGNEGKECEVLKKERRCCGFGALTTSESVRGKEMREVMLCEESRRGEGKGTEIRLEVELLSMLKRWLSV